MPPRTDPQGGYKTFLNRLYQLIPIEITGAYLAIHTLLKDPAAEDSVVEVLLMIGLLCLLALLPLYLFRVRHVTSVSNVIFTTATFAIWSASISSDQIANLLSDFDLTNTVSRYVDIIIAITMIISTVVASIWLVRPEE